MDGELGRPVPTLPQGVHREPIVIADGDQPAVTHEGVDLEVDEFPAVRIELHCVARQEPVGGVVVELGSLMGPEGVLDRELV